MDETTSKKDKKYKMILDKLELVLVNQKYLEQAFDAQSKYMKDRFNLFDERIEMIDKKLFELDKKLNNGKATSVNYDNETIKKLLTDVEILKRILAKL